MEMKYFFCGFIFLLFQHSSLAKMSKEHFERSYTSLTQRVQSNIVNSVDFVPLNIETHWHKKPFSFKKSKPYFEKKDGEGIDSGIIHIQGLLSEEEPYVLNLKCKTQGSYLKEFENIKSGSPISAKEMNRRIINNQMAKRINTNLKIAFLPDIVYGDKPTAAFSWFKERIMCEYNNNEQKLYIRSPVMITSDNLFIKQYAGLHYMKILTPMYADFLINKYGDKIY